MSAQLEGFFRILLGVSRARESELAIEAPAPEDDIEDAEIVQEDE